MISLRILSDGFERCLGGDLVFLFSDVHIPDTMIPSSDFTDSLNRKQMLITFRTIDPPINLKSYNANDPVKTNKTSRFLKTTRSIIRSNLCH